MTRPYTPAWKAAMALCCVAAVMAIVMQPAQADEWTSKDKAGHAQAGALIGGIAAAASQSTTVGCLMAVDAGIAKEAYDSQHLDKHTASYKDATVTAAFGCLAAKFTSLIVGPNRIVFRKEF